jgi:hypothetical protein
MYKTSFPSQVSLLHANLIQVAYTHHSVSYKYSGRYHEEAFVGQYYGGKAFTPALMAIISWLKERS